MRFRSNSEDAVEQALKDGVPCWMLDTGNDGENDVLVGGRDEVIDDLLAHYEIKELPSHWILTKVVLEN